MKAPSTALLRTFSPLWQNPATSWTARACAQQQPQCANFSSTRSNMARKGRGGEKRDMRIIPNQSLAIPFRPHAQLTLAKKSNRSLRHWTIHRAWRLYQSKLHTARERELERQYNSMASACEALRLIDNHGLTTEERGKLAAEGEPTGGKEMGRLFRIAMRKDGVWDGVPIEYARIQTETPPREGFNEGWTR
ncbi:hypothetical protein D0859_13305 [Hortaea werneckii]|uniref:Uncharacterized protein n=1 Tax=Hortaea werneckii TaxID=91943 RepID=A0A3M7IB03_HORWE|nr:hypothetical protein D0859_13305 [Hortaea werneckii]